MKNDYFKWQKATPLNIKSKISEADILHLYNEVNLRTYPTQKLCLIIHPSREQDLTAICNAYIPKSQTQTQAISTIFSMTVYKDEFCPINKIHILPELEYLNMEKTLL